MEIVVDVIMKILEISFWFIVLLIPLVAIHEFGHLLFARLFKVKVLEYGIGLPPRAFYKKWKGIVWSINWLPLGGFAKIYGDHDAIDEAKDMSLKDAAKAKLEYIENRTSEIISNRELQFFLEENNIDYTDKWKEFEIQLKKRKIEATDSLLKQLKTLIEWEYDAKLSSKHVLFNKKYWQKVLIMLGGIIFNLLFAWIMLSMILGFSTIKKNVTDIDYAEQLRQDTTIVSEGFFLQGIIKDSPADKAGLEPGDEIVRYDDRSAKDIFSFQEFTDLVNDNGPSEVIVEYKSNKTDTNEVTIITAEKSEDDDRYKIGVIPMYTLEYEGEGFWGTIGSGYDETVWTFKETVKSVGDIFTALLPSATDQEKEILKQVSGPIGIGNLGSQIFEQGGIALILYAMATISVFLAVFNLVPIPALDGGRILILTINKITGKRSKKVEAIAITLTMLLMIGLMILVAVSDIKKL